ncbi:MAG: class I SAM-dependent methyltransferase [Nevskiaceae bacterium]|nr:MAG: class I SAM-dependent methyltransferase [Nevskiaceae bacterium]
MANIPVPRALFREAHWKVAVDCKICRSSSSLYGVVDFNKSCEEAREAFLPLLGWPVYYYQCSVCGLVFTVDFDHWSKQQFIDEIYNQDYVKVDPDYAEVRPINNAKMVAEFVQKNTTLAMLDYGGGNGRLAAELTALGFDAMSFDPMIDDAPAPDGSGYQLITAFEVMEHTPNPVETMAEMAGFLGDGGAILFSTLTIDSLPPRNVGFWYISPRNGHVTIYTKKSLQVLAEGLSLEIHHFNDGLHLVYDKVPSWLK